MLDTAVLAPVAPAPSPAVSEDETLARAAVAGDTAAYEAIYRRHAPRLYAVAWRICGGNAARAEDVLQEAFIKAWQALPGFRFQSALGTWLHRLVVNTALMELRARSVAQDLEDEDDALAALPGRDGAAGAVGLDLERAVATLPPRARAVLVLHDIEGWKHHEIAEELGMAVGSSKAQLHRARGLLRKRLGEPA
ncbi:RNA polymerase sigma factor [Coralloluteibacterium thermophilus]|uniref:RNA polymerase sigma factor n=1 Tax=Coralloluteibacterium thermophilum TaxID=2707049 RepID=A0ABV9NG71_9GAMM